MEFSIIIPTYNSSKYIRECLEHIYLMEYSEDCYEIIVVDGGSTDGTLAIVTSYEKVRLLYSSNISIANSRNIGVAASCGEYLLFIDSDCLVDRFLLSKAKMYLTRYSCYGSFYKPHESHGWVASAWLMVERKDDGLVKWLTSGTLAVSRALFDDVKGFDETLEAEEDEDFCKRIRNKGGHIRNDSSVASVHLGQPDTVKGFFLKETWRGKSLVKPLAEIGKSKISIFDLAIYLYFLAIVVLFVAVPLRTNSLATVAIIMIIVLPLLLTVRVAIKRRSCKMIGHILLMYYVYLWARCWSIVRYNQLSRVFCRRVS